MERLNNKPRAFYKTPTGKYHTVNCRYWKPSMAEYFFTPNDIRKRTKNVWSPYDPFCWHCAYHGDTILEIQAYKWRD